LQVGSEVDLGFVVASPSPPEVEDHVFDSRTLRRIRDLAPVELEILLSAVAEPSLGAVFGAALELDGRTASAAMGSPGPSLGCLSPVVAPRLELPFDTVKLALEEDGRKLSVAVTDLRLFEADQRTPDRGEIRRVNAAIDSGRVLLSVGLSRPFSKPGDGRLRHWLQINNVHVFPG
jgi:hypothetical protein